MSELDDGNVHMEGYGEIPLTVDDAGEPGPFKALHPTPGGVERFRVPGVNIALQI